MNREIKFYWSKVLALVLTLCLTAAPVFTAGNNERIVVTYAMWGSKEDIRALEQAIKKFESEQDRIRVQFLQVDRADYIDTLNTLAASGILTDTALMAEDAVMMWANQNALAGLSAMYGEGETKPLDSLTFMYNGAPVAYSTTNEVLLLFYNREAFITAGMVPPAEADNAWDWDTFVDTAKSVTLDANGNNAKSPDFDPNNIARYGVTFNPDVWQLEVWPASNGGAWYDAGGNVAINTPEATEALQRIADLHLVHHVSPRFGAQTAADIAQDFIGGKSAMYISGQWEIGTSLAPAKKDGFDYGVAVLPYMKEKVTLGTGGANVVFATSRNPDAAMEWLKWYAKPQNAWGLIENGIWMPVLPEYYTDDALTRKWAENPNFPPYEEYKTAVVDYAMNNAIPAAWYRVNNTNLFNDELKAILTHCWTGEVTVADAIARNITALITANRG